MSALLLRPDTTWSVPCLSSTFIPLVLASIDYHYILWYNLAPRRPPWPRLPSP